MEFPRTAIVILNWNGKSFLEKFLPSVTKHSDDCEIYLADNASSDDSVNFVQSNYPAIKIIRNAENGGFAKGYNDALKFVDAELLILLNSDIETPPDWTMPLRKFMAENKAVAACQPKILDYHNKTKFEYAGACGGFIDKYGYPFCRGRIFNQLEEDEGQYNDAIEVFWATGACMVIRKEIFSAVGGFDEDYFAHMEEIDLCWRIKNLGHQIYVIPSSHIYHVGGGTLKKVNPRKTFLNFRNNLITYTRNYAGGFLFFKVLYRIILDGIAGAKFLLEGNPAHTLAVVKAHWVYFFSIGKTLKKRRLQKKQKNFFSEKTGIYKGNIVFKHYLGGIKKFSDLDL
jgi:GT2 family glycosyltransferase